MLLPLFPGLLRHVVEDVLALGAGIWRAVQAGQFLFVLAAEHGAGHESSPIESSATRLSSFFTGAARPRRGGAERLYQSQSPSAMTPPRLLAGTSLGSMLSCKWLKVWVKAGRARGSPSCRPWRSARACRSGRASISGRLHRPPHSPVGGRR